MTPQDKTHDCGQTDCDDRPLPPQVAVCGICGLYWCDRCDPTPAALCPDCHGTGTTAPIYQEVAR
jgi:hypothetical protein